MLEPNASLELAYRVGAADLAKRLSLDAADDFPEVFATSRMIALMELAAARLMRSELEDGEFPFEQGHDEAAWSKNRRAHFVITAR